MPRTPTQLIDGQELQAFSSSNTFLSRLLSDSSGNLSITPGSGLSIINKNSIGATQGAYGLEVINNTAATLGNQQYSPNVIWQGYGFKTNDSTSRSVAFRAYTKPVQATTNPLAKWTLEHSVAAGSWTETMNCDQSGNLTIVGVLSAASVASVGAVTGTNISMNSTGNSVGDLTVSNLTGSKPVFTDGSSKLSSSGTVGIANGGTGSTSFSSGSVIFSAGSVLSENNAQFAWDNSSNILYAGVEVVTSTFYGNSMRLTGLSASSPVFTDGTSFLTSSGVVGVANGGTGFSSLISGDIFYASASTTMATLSATSTGNVLLSGSSPSWGKVALTTHVSGTLPIANGGTNNTSFVVGGIVAFDGTSLSSYSSPSVNGSGLLTTVGSTTSTGLLIYTTASGGVGQTFTPTQITGSSTLAITSGSALTLNATSNTIGLSTNGSIVVEIGTSGGNRAIGFFGASIAQRASAYTVTNRTTDRSYDADATSVAELADVLGTLILDLQTYGLLQ